MSKLLILGAGGHGKVVADAAKSMAAWNEIAFLDDEFGNLNKCLDYRVVAKLDDFNDFISDYDDFIVAIGNNQRRIHYLERLLSSKFNVPVVIHPSSIVSSSSRIQPGTVVVAGSIINPDVDIGYGCIINTGTTIDHDCVIDDGVHLSPGVNLGGNVKVGKNTWIGIGATVKNNVEIGSDVIIGAGSVVLDNIVDSSKAVGVPARCVLDER